MNDDQLCAGELVAFGWDCALLLCVFIAFEVAGIRLLMGQAGYEDISMVSAISTMPLIARLQ